MLPSFVENCHFISTVSASSDLEAVIEVIEKNTKLSENV